MVDVTYIQKGFRLTEKNKKYILEKLMKHEELLGKATSISAFLRFNNKYPQDRKFRMEISVSMPHTFIKVENRGFSVEELTDRLEVILKRKLKRYVEQYKKWEKEEPWKIKEAKELINDFEEVSSYTDYQPSVKTSKLETNRPMHIGEAIERLEMSGKSAFLFKNYTSDKYGMLIRNEYDEYELIEADV